MQRELGRRFNADRPVPYVYRTLPRAALDQAAHCAQLRQGCVQLRSGWIQLCQD